MGLTTTSTGTKLLDDSLESLKESCDYTVALAGNPNVGKSTIFNALTGLHQHTGNWPGKTVSNAAGTYEHNGKEFLLVDLPGTYSLMSNSQEEEIARDYICFGNPDATIVIVDATCIERNLNLVFQTMEITNNIIVCVNLLDEAKKKGIHLDLEKLSRFLGVPVVGTTARKPKTLKKLLTTVATVCQNKQNPIPKLVTYPEVIENAIHTLMPLVSPLLPKEQSYLSRWVCLKLIDTNSKMMDSLSSKLHFSVNSSTALEEALENLHTTFATQNFDINQLHDKLVSSIVFTAENICTDIITYENSRYSRRDRKIDKILTSKCFGFPIMLLFLGIIFWLTITGANYPSSLLSEFFGVVQLKLLDLFNYLHAPAWLSRYPH